VQFSADFSHYKYKKHGPYYTNSGYLPVPFSYTMVNYYATDHKGYNVSDQLILLPVCAQTTQVGLLDKDY